MAETDQFDRIARGLVIGWTERLTLAPGTRRDRCIELDVERAWPYVNGAFLSLI